MMKGVRQEIIALSIQQRAHTSEYFEQEAAAQRRPNSQRTR
jgi:hypothetical protein